jgi:hypothetical protein
MVVTPKGVFAAPNGHVVITSPSTMTGTEHSVELPMTVTEYRRAMEHYNKGALIQDAFPRLTAEQREFLLTGITPEEWETLKEEEEEEDSNED